MGKIALAIAGHDTVVELKGIPGTHELNRHNLPTSVICALCGLKGYAFAGSEHIVQGFENVRAAGKSDSLRALYRSLRIMSYLTGPVRLI
jgi:hypothetical protein